MMLKYAIWQNGKVASYIELTRAQARKLNEMQGIGLHFGFDETTNREIMQENNKTCENINLKELRKLTGMSQKEFSEKYNIPLTTFQNWEADKEKPNHRECPIYVKQLLKRAVEQDYK